MSAAGPQILHGAERHADVHGPRPLPPCPPPAHTPARPLTQPPSHLNAHSRVASGDHPKGAVFALITDDRSRMPAPLEHGGRRRTCLNAVFPRPAGSRVPKPRPRRFPLVPHPHRNNARGGDGQAEGSPTAKGNPNYRSIPPVLSTVKSEAPWDPHNFPPAITFRQKLRWNFGKDLGDGIDIKHCQGNRA